MGSRLFSDFTELSDETRAVLGSQGFSHATPVQEATIPLFCGNKDVSVDACTGSGKTLAFVLPIIEKLRRLENPLKNNQIGAIIVSPTRELARQIHEVAAPYVASLGWANSALLVGGTDTTAAVAELRSAGATILVGTPGRLDDVLTRAAFLDPRSLEILVLDEADRLLDMGFRRQVDAIIARLPRQRRTGLFSATQTEAVKELARAGLRNPVRVAVAVSEMPAAGGKGGKGDKGAAGGAGTQNGAPAFVPRTPSSLSLEYRVCEAGEKLPLLLAFLAAHAGAEKIIVYFLTCANVDYASLALSTPGALPADCAAPGRERTWALHGRMKQAAREATVAAFAAAPAGVLLATDVAARGLDFPDVHWVVQVDPPQDPDAFVHRVGRTARMGRSGQSLLLLLPNELPYVDFLKRRGVPLVEAGADVAPLPASDRDETVFGSSRLAASLRAAGERDRAVMEAATRAFVSFLRGYREHQCSFIFRLGELPLGRLAASLGLLRLPGMPELRKPRIDLSGFTESAVDADAVRFKDKTREKQRLASVAARGAAKAAEKEAERKARARVAASAANARLPAVKRRALETAQDDAELANEYRALTKLRRGKISSAECDAAMGIRLQGDRAERVSLVEDTQDRRTERARKRKQREAKKRQ